MKAEMDPVKLVWKLLQPGVLTQEEFWEIFWMILDQGVKRRRKEETLSQMEEAEKEQESESPSE